MIFLCFLVMLRFFIFSWGSAYDFLKLTTKVTEVIKAKTRGNLRYGHGGMCKKLGSFLNTYVIDVFNKGVIKVCLKEFAKVLW